MDFQVYFLNFLAILWTMCVHIEGTELDLTIDVEPGKKECLYQTINVGITYEVEYQVKPISIDMITLAH